MSIAIDDAYFMLMTGVWKMSDLSSWVEEQSEEAVEAARDDIFKEGHNEGYAEGRKDGFKEALSEVEDSIAQIQKYFK
jgi:flagellar biosynthesis/type III secretory pathway protein FliH